MIIDQLSMPGPLEKTISGHFVGYKRIYESLKQGLNVEEFRQMYTAQLVTLCSLSPPYTYRLLVVNSSFADRYLATIHWPAVDRQIFQMYIYRSPQKVLPSVGGEHTHNEYVGVAS